MFSGQQRWCVACFLESFFHFCSAYLSQFFLICTARAPKVAGKDNNYMCCSVNLLQSDQSSDCTSVPFGSFHFAGVDG